MDGHELDQMAAELFTAFSHGEPLAAPPSSMIHSFDIADAYAVADRAAALKKQAGHLTVGRKVGFANKAMWRLLKLDTLVWGYMWDDTVHQLAGSDGSLALSGMLSPRIEPEVVLRINQTPDLDARDAAWALKTVEWMALGFEINDCIFPDWKFKPVDFVATLGFHKALVIGQPVAVTIDNIETLAGQLASFKLRLYKNGELAAEGAGRNSLRSPALCLTELANALARQPEAEPLTAGEFVSTGTLTDALAVAPGEEWKAEVEGIALSPLSVRFVAN
jgi:2-oxo-3-hexenedioate decarboxylase